MPMNPTTNDDFAVARYLAQPISVPQGTQLSLNSTAYYPGSADMTSLTYAWSVTGPTGYVMPAGTATGNAGSPDLLPQRAHGCLATVMRAISQCVGRDITAAFTNRKREFSVFSGQFSVSDGSRPPRITSD